MDNITFCDIVRNAHSFVHAKWVGVTGIEPARATGTHQIPNLARLPIPAHPRNGVTGVP